VKRIIIVFLLMLSPVYGQDNVLTLKQGLKHVLENSPEMKSARMQAQSGALEIDKAESKLGWKWNSVISAEQDVSFIGAPFDRNSVTAGLSKPLSVGGELELGAGYTYEDSTLAFSPSLPNPSNSSRADISYRLPLGKGRGNVEYHSGLKKAQAQRDAAAFDYLGKQESMGSQFIERYHGAAFTQRRLKHARNSLNRSKRLQQHIAKNERLGISEKEDRLQANARVHARVAELKSLELIWTQQRNALNRMMMQAWNQEFTPVVEIAQYDASLEDVLADITARDPYVARARAQVEQNSARINDRRDNKRDTLDVIFSVGYRGLSGEDSNGVDVNETDKAGSLSIEYQRGLDKRGVDAELMQAQLDYDVALQQLAALEADMEYNVSSLHVETLRNQESVAAQRARLKAETAKYKDGLFRYRDGRIDTSRLIQYEDELSAAELTLSKEEIELAQRQAIISLLRGNLMPADGMIPAKGDNK
jgi:outer membrane protein TolC